MYIKNLMNMVLKMDGNYRSVMSPIRRFDLSHGIEARLPSFLDFSAVLSRYLIDLPRKTNRAILSSM